MSAESNSANDSFEYAVFYIVLAFAGMMAYMLFHIYGWHFIKLNFFQGVEQIPEDIRRIIFFWKQDLADVVPSIANYMSEHDATFFEDTKEGISRKGAIDSAMRWLFMPYILVLILLFFIKGVRTKSGNIKRSKHGSI